MAELGKLRRIDAREVWKHEAHDFTPWLKEHIGLLGEALGMDLDLVEAEVPVGPFSADLVGKDLSSDRWVVIENQLEATDHSHLGQLLTYGAGTEAGVFVWIAPEFREEHRAAMDWLNEHSGEESLFFGVVIELLAVDDSKPAPNFRLVSIPNEWQKTTRSTRSTPTKRGSAYQEFFQGVLEDFKAKFPGETNVSRPSKDSWQSLGSGRPGLGYYTWAFTVDKTFRVELYIDSGDAEANASYFEQFFSHKEAIESAVGEPLDWDVLEGRRACRISLCYSKSPISVLDDELALAPLTKWAVETMKHMRDGFRPFIEGLEMNG